MLLGGMWLLGDGCMRAPAAAGVGSVQPFLRLWQGVLEGLRQGVVRATAGRSRETELRLRVEELEAQLALARRSAAEGEELRWQFVAASVVARDPVSWGRRFRLNRGRLHGIVAGAAVVAGGGVVGRVSECGTATCEVTTLLDPACRLSVLVGSGDGAGIVSGRAGAQQEGEPACVVTFLPAEFDCEPDTVVVTSGLGTRIPGGLVVGTVRAPAGGPVVGVVDKTYGEVGVRPQARIARVAHVVVVCPLGVWDRAPR